MIENPNAAMANSMPSIPKAKPKTTSLNANLKKLAKNQGIQNVKAIKTPNTAYASKTYSDQKQPSLRAKKYMVTGLNQQSGPLEPPEERKLQESPFKQRKNKITLITQNSPIYKGIHTAKNDVLHV
jgi:hypothetical protein